MRSGQLASRLQRLFAAALDLFALLFGALVFLIVSGVLEHADAWAIDPETGGGAGVVIWLGVSIVAGYYLVHGAPLLLRSQTLGKMLVGLFVVDNETGEKASKVHMLLVRPLFFCLILAPAFFPPIAVVPLADHIMVLGKARSCVHDKMSGTTVIRAT